MIMSPLSSNGTSMLMKVSTAAPAFTNNITLRGFLRKDTISSSDLAPMMFVPESSMLLTKSNHLKYDSNIPVKSISKWLGNAFLGNILVEVRDVLKV